VKFQGNVKYYGNPLCAMVLANGQYMFSCSGDGSDSLNVPLDFNGEITLFNFVDGLQPYKQIFKPLNHFTQILTMEVLMSITPFTKTLTLFVLALFIVAADDITRTLPEGTDVSTLRCSGHLVYIGDFSRDVLEKCGEPIKKVRFIDQPGRVWVYHLDQADHVFYLAFIDGKLERIFDVRCWEDNPDCE